MREIRARRRKLDLHLRVDPQGSEPCRLYPAIRDHESVKAVQAWLAAIEGLSLATNVIRARLPEGDLRQVMVEMAGFSKRARIRVSLAVSTE